MANDALQVAGICAGVYFGAGPLVDPSQGVAMERPRWFAVGRACPSDDRPGFRGADAALVGDDAKVLVVFCSQGQDVVEVVRQISDRSGGVRLFGCSTAGEIAAGGPGDASVVVAALGGPGFSVRTALAEGASKDLRGAGVRAAAAVDAAEDAERPHQLL